MPRIGVSEVVMLFIVSAVSLGPIVVAVWAMVTLQRIRAGQETMRRQLEAIERALGSGAAR